LSATQGLRAGGGLGVDFSKGPSAKGQPSKYPGFSICMEKKDGQRYRREYALLGIAVRFAGEHACEPPLPPPFEIAGAPAPLPVTPSPDSQPSESLFQRLKKRWHSLTGAGPGK
jgi:hypothetical protein